MNDHCEIPLGRNGDHVAIVSVEDYAFLTRWRWNWKRSRGGNIYARRGGGTDKRGLRPTILMHVVIMERIEERPTAEHTPDHLNCNSLDNRRHNLEWATKSQQRKNQRRHKPPATKADGNAIPF